MARAIAGRMTADIEGDFVVFLIGMRFNKPWKVWKWWPVLSAMPRMIRVLRRHPELGLLHAYQTIGSQGPLMVQYWRDAERLEAFARDARLPHHPAWRAFNKAVGAGGDVGIWHETYLVRAGQYETVYGNMPPFGLAVAGEHLPAARKGDSAEQRRRADATKAAQTV